MRRARRQGTTKEEFEGLTDFLDALEPLKNPPSELVELAHDPAIPVYVRLAARAVLPEEIDAATLSAAIAALASDEWQQRSAALTLLTRADDVALMLGNILTDNSVNGIAKTYLVENLSRIVRDQSERQRIASMVLKRAGVDRRHRDVLLVYQLRAGDRAAFEEMIDRIEQAPIDVVQNILASLNSIPDAALGHAVLAKVRARSDTPSNIVGLAGTALVGLTKRLTMDSWDGYGMEDAARHPAWPAWRQVFDDWIATEGLSTVERLCLINRMLEIRPELVRELQEVIFSATEPDSPEWDEDKDGHHLRSGMDELRRRGVLIPLSLAETFVRAKRPNLRYAGAAAIGAHGTRDALDLLLALYRSIRKDRSSIVEEIEVLAARLGVTIMPVDLA